MNVRAFAAVAVAVGAGVLGIAGCGNSVHSCGIADYVPTGQHGFATPRQVLSSALVANPSLSQDGWQKASQGTRAVEFRSGDDSVDAVKRADGLWVIGGVTNCQ
jgi:hypothetical protein